MAINWGQLTPIAAPQVIGSLPAVAPDNSANSLMGGIMQGVAQADQLKTNALSRAATQQSMDQSAQIFPYQLQNTKAVAGQNQIALDEAKITQQGLQEMRANIDKGVQQAIDAQMKVDPIGAMKSQQQYAETQKAQGQASQEMAKGEMNQLEVIDHIRLQGAQMAESAIQYATDPQTGQIDWKKADAIYQQSLAPVVQNAPEMRTKFAANLDPTTFALIQKDAMYSATNIAARQLKDAKPSDTKKRLDEVNVARQAAGQAPMSPEEQANVLQKGLDTSINPNKGQVNPTDTAIAQADAQTLKDIETRKTSGQQVHQIVAQAQTILKDVPEGLLGPVQGIFNLAKVNPKAQELISNLNNLTLLAKAKYNMGSQGFTDADREFVKAINGDISNYKGTLESLLKQADTLQTHQDQQDWLREYNIYKKGSDGGKQFLQDNPEPMATIKYKGQLGQIPLTRLEEYKKQGAELQ